MTEEDGRALAGTPKMGDPSNEWQQARPNTFTNSFGVTDASGIGIPGLHVEFAVVTSPYLKLVKYIFTLMLVEFPRPGRAYQIEINLRNGLKPNDHAYSHEHYGQGPDGRYPADESWANAGFQEAVNIFCSRCNLSLENPLPDYMEFALK